MIAYAEKLLLERGLAGQQDLVVMVGALPLQVGARTNFVQLHTIGQTMEPHASE
ncbi:MAG TPA: hypothetical protein VJL08_01990 [Dehalococcoidia bacterium]|nr:hypothetical protein [Dehalococcoidia bacterium]